MDFLKEIGITDEVIRRIETLNDKALLFNFICSKENVIKNINYLQSIGIKAINSLLIYRLDFIMIDHDKLKSACESYETSVLAQLINEDINAVNLL